MTINAENSRNHDLVNRYAARIRSRHSGAAMPMRSGRRSHGLQTFGRRPVSRTRPGPTRSRQAITALMATAIMATSAPAAGAVSSSGYEVRSGDTLSQIAANHGISVEELVEINGIDNPDQILVGAELQFGPQSGKDLPQDNGELDNGELDNGELDDVQVGDTVYEIKEGDSLTGLAIEFDVMLNDLLTVNEIENVDLIEAGDFLIIPTGSDDETEVPAGDEPAEIPVDEEPIAEASSSDEAISGDPDVDEPVDNQAYIVSLHLVGRGETPGGVALRYGITVDQLMQANGRSASDMISYGEMLSIPDASWVPGQTTNQNSEVVTEEAPAESDVSEDGAGTILEGMPVQQQSLSLSCESAALSIATAYWGHQVSEWVFIENMPYHENPHRGFRGDMNGAFGGADDYGVYAKPLANMLANYGFIGEEFYTMGDPQELKERIDRGQPVLVWMTSGATAQDRLYEWHQGERYSLTPQQHTVVVYGYDEDNVYVSDPGTGQYETYSWDAFTQSWGQFDGMSMAVYPKG
jgi:uncharacterized protein YvpB